MNASTIPMELTEDEKELYDELIVQIAVCYRKKSFDGEVWEDNQGREGPSDFKNYIIGHGFLSDFETACAVLVDSGVAVPINHDGSPKLGPDLRSAYFRILFDVEELRAHLAHHLPPSAPSINDVIAGFLSVTIDHGYAITARRTAFPVPAGFERLFALLADCGYVERVGQQVKWTEKVRPAMCARYLWNEDGLSSEEAEEARTDEMWRSMPWPIRTLFFPIAGFEDHFLVMLILEHYWEGNRWKPTSWETIGFWVIARLFGVRTARAALIKRINLHRGHDDFTLRDAHGGIIEGLSRKYWESRR
ncbi:MAG: hypothetical protein MI741_15430 [Rhodospirillales bacterium]|nr:hypothetical protein [Rhodospirillales bacterium]